MFNMLLANFQQIVSKMNPYTFKYLLRSYLDPPNPPQTPSQKVLGGLGIIVNKGQNQNQHVPEMVDTG